jgi:hypothetical protein
LKNDRKALIKKLNIYKSPKEKLNIGDKIDITQFDVRAKLEGKKYIRIRKQDIP